MDKLSRICERSYKFINMGAPILNNLTTDTPLHNKARLKVSKKSITTFDGKLSCGAASYLLSYYLSKHHYYNTLMTTTLAKKDIYANKNFPIDHTYLYHNYHIIDPTYKQMFLPNPPDYIDVDGDDEYHKFLFTELPFVFIGTFEELVSMHYELDRLHAQVYDGNRLPCVLDFWQMGVDRSRYSDCDKVLDDLSYAYKKGTPFVKLHINMSHHIDIAKLW